MKLLILGVDPGTTVGYAVLDLEGKVVAVRSAKELDISLLISEVIEFGKVVAVGTDKKRVPDFVDKVATKLGSRIIAPDEDLCVEDKHAMSAGFETKNSHEMDALASSIFAYKKLEPLLLRIDRVLLQKGKERFSSPVKELLLTKDGLNISSALKIAENPPLAKEVATLITERKKISEKDYFSLWTRLVEAEKEAAMLLKNNELLQKEIKRQKKKKQKIKKMIAGKSKDEEILIKDKNIASLHYSVEKQENRIKDLNSRLHTLYNILGNSSNGVVVKRIATLLSSDVSSVEIFKEDVLLVDNPNIFSEQGIESLDKKVRIILSKTPLSKKTKQELKFVLIEPPPVILLEEEHFALVDKKEFFSLVKKAEIVDKILMDYRHERSL